MYTDWGLLDSGLHPQHLQQAAVGCHRQKVAITETKGTVNRLALHTHNLTAEEGGEEWGGVCVCVCIWKPSYLSVKTLSLTPRNVFLMVAMTDRYEGRAL